MAKLRLVAYREVTTGTENQAPYELDLQKEPNISLNLRFSDIKDPDTRKASFSQTFKLPFTDNNNEFFQNWYNVNLKKLVYTSTKRFPATLFYGTTVQFEGFLQLKSVYRKAQVYEVVLFDNVVDLFKAVGDKKLKDVFKNDDDTYTTEWNHLFTYVSATNNTLYNSWAGTLTNTAGVSLQDASAGVSKVVYPLSFTQPTGYFKSTLQRYLNMSESTNSAYATLMSQFRPALQLKAILNLIFAKSGFTYTSAFIDGSYFGKLFMTTGNELTSPGPAIANTDADPWNNSLQGGSSQVWGVYDDIAPLADCAPPDANTPFTPFVADYFGPELVEEYFNPNGIWDATNNTFTRITQTMISISVKMDVAAYSTQECGSPYGDPMISLMLVRWDEDAEAPDLDTVYWSTAVSYPLYQAGAYSFNSFIVEATFDLYNMPVGSKGIVMIKHYNFADYGGVGQITLGSATMYGDFLGNTYSLVTGAWDYDNNTVYNNNVDVPACMSTSITQKAFLKDLIQRFNLIIIADPSNPSNLIIEPYNDYINAGTTKFWSDKLDTEKEIIITDTSKLQKKSISLTDLDDKDLMNKVILETMPELSVLGKLEIIDTLNDFATGELKNDPIFAPYINQMIGKSIAEADETELLNVAAHYEIGYETTLNQPLLEATQPKLFYYNGTPTPIQNSGGAQSIYMHIMTLVNPSAAAKEFTHYPVCTPWDITPNGDNEYVLTAQNKCLYWGFAPPAAPNLTMFNYVPDGINWTSHTLFFAYWKTYLDNLYSEQSRIMECYLNIDSADLSDFNFNDQIFIEGSFWRVLEINNYQVGGETSTKVKLIKVLDTITYTGDYVLATQDDGAESVGAFFWFCPNDGTSCGGGTLFVDEASCLAYGGEPWTQFANQAPLYPCLASVGSLPLNLESSRRAISFFTGRGTKSLITNKMLGTKNSFVKGSANTKYSKPIISNTGDAYVIKHRSSVPDKPQVNGEVHRMVLTGYTEGNTTGYAYPQGNPDSPEIKIPMDSNTIIRVNGTSTVVGGTSSTYVKGETEGFGYYTAFKNVGGVITQLSTTGGVEEFNLRGSVGQACTLYIDVSGNVLRFGLKDSQTDTKRTWSLSVELVVQELINLEFGYGDDRAIWQNARLLYFQDNTLMIWN